MANLASRLDRRRMRIERVTRRLLRREFARYAREASENPNSLNRPTREHSQRLAVILGAAYEPSILLGLENAEEQLVKAAKQVEQLEPVADRLLLEWIEQRAFTRAASISTTSRHAAQGALEQAIAQGLGEQATSQLIRDAVGDMAPWRARMIARTETHGAMMNASNQAADTLGATTKEWVAIEDDRTRQTHMDADTQEVPLDSGFLVGNSVLRFPGDPAGPPEETINCRCAVAYS